MYKSGQKLNLIENLIEKGIRDTDESILKDDFTSLSYKALIKNLLHYHDYYENLGLRGNYVVLSLENSVEWVIAFLSLASIDAKIIPVSPNVNKNTLRYLEKNLPHLKIVNSLKEGLISSCTHSTYNQALLEKTLVIDGKNIVIHLTSGSTGEPKLCKRTYESLINEGLNYGYTLQMSKEDHILNPLPLYHSFAFGFSLISSLVTGSKLTILNSYNPRKLISRIQSERPTIVPCVPFIADNLAKLFISKKPDVSSVRTLLIGAGKVTYETRSLLLNKYGFHSSLNYGSTETGGIVTNTNMFPIKSVGRPMSNVKIKILDEITLQEVDPLVRGEVWVKAPTMFTGYINEENSPFNENGYYPMGDLGYVDFNGNLFLNGRKDKILKIGGRNINISYVEKKIGNFACVSDCKVYVQKRPSDEYILKALIQCKDDGEDNNKIVNEKILRELPKYMIPLVTFVEKIPRNDLGKKIVGQI